MADPSGGLEAYRTVATELGDPEVTIADLDPHLVQKAQTYAKKNKKKWPPRPISDGWEVRVWQL